jgi:hypothetical protein
MSARTRRGIAGSAGKRKRNGDVRLIENHYRQTVNNRRLRDVLLQSTSMDAARE